MRLLDDYLNQGIPFSVVIYLPIMVVDYYLKKAMNQLVAFA